MVDILPAGMARAMAKTMTLLGEVAARGGKVYDG